MLHLGRGRVSANRVRMKVKEKEKHLKREGWPHWIFLLVVVACQRDCSKLVTFPYILIFFYLSMFTHICMTEEPDD